VTNNTDYSLPERTIYGKNSLEKLKDEINDLGLNILVVTYDNKRETPIFFKKVLELLESSRNKLFIFDKVELEPSINNIDEASNYARNKKIDIVIGVGGGSVIDFSKAVSVLLTNPGSIREYQLGITEIINKGKKIIAIPTTAGTGSEATKVAVITNKEKKIKKSIIHPYLMPSLVVLDPNLIKDLPKRLTALTGIDALSHAIESYLSLLDIPLAEAAALKAIDLISKNLLESFKNPYNLDARLKMQLGSYLAGISLISSVGAGHRLAQPISSITGLSHSEAISVVFINVLRMNYKYCREKYKEIAKLIGLDINRINTEDIGNKLIDWFENLYNEMDIEYRFKDYNIEPILFNSIIENARKTTSHLVYNPRPLNDELLMEILNMSQ